MKKFASILLCCTLIAGCGISNTGKGSLIGSGAGAALGAGIGYLIGGNGQGAAIGAAIGTAVGAGSGALIGKRMDKKAAEMADMQDTNINVYGHTDNIGTAAANKKVSDQRASTVAKYLNTKGIANERIVAEGLSFDFPVADNNTEAGRAQNRRVEIYVSANEKMVQAAEAGALK